MTLNSNLTSKTLKIPRNKVKTKKEKSPKQKKVKKKPRSSMIVIQKQSKRENKYIKQQNLIQFFTKIKRQKRNVEKKFTKKRNQLSLVIQMMLGESSMTNQKNSMLDLQIKNLNSTMTKINQRNQNKNTLNVLV